ncbi:ATP-binding protein [Stenotrophomonas maltophilia]|uniref:ATP-binding protein n=1 Tax=Stenotrophomonas maltophilia TaxID=40324 RepID=UPI00111081C2|nr:ATP-binding protein [Stenotrophomonas maltophilia]MBH1444581.1 ATP-binding protein [Stenotrophomonas maltophilia]TIL11188.1 ATP-binding protein [Stenotrophomonas maltophilia]
MIYSFTYEGKIFNLLPLNVRTGQGWNIFNAHSMSLLIGANGSGKTEFLSRLCEAIRDKNESDLEAGVDLSKYGVIYFTPAPVARSRFPRSGKRFKLLEGADRKFKADPKVVATLSREFRFSNSIVARLAVPMERGLDALFAAAMEFPTDYSSEFAELFGSRFKDYVERSHRWRSYDGVTDEEIDARQQDMLDAQSSLRTTIRNYLRKAYGPDYSNAILAAIAHGSLRGRKRIVVARRFWKATLRGGQDVEDVLPDFKKFIEIFKKLGPKVAKRGVAITDKRRSHLERQFGEILSFELSGLSSGAEALVRQFFKLSSAIGELRSNGISNLILMIDEGDAFLHIAWQQRYVDYLNRFIGKEMEGFDSVQVVLASHSPVLMSDFPRDFLINLGQGDFGCQKSFGAPLELIIESAAGAGTVGTFAARSMKGLVKRKFLRPRDHYLIDQLDDPIVKSFISRRRSDNIN